MASVDQGISIEFRPLTKVVAANGVPGNPPSSHGVGGLPKFDGSIAPNDYTPGRDLGVSTDLRAPNSGLNQIARITYYLMRAYESGGSCSGLIPRIWIVQNAPDTTGVLYLGARCSPTPGTFSNFCILAKWTQ
jgi:hypothetical protein